MSILKELGYGAVANIVSKYLNVIIQFFLMIFFARILSPIEFGEVSLIMTILVFFNYMGNMGIGAGIIQKNLNEDEIRDSFVFSIFLGGVICVFYIFISKFLGYFYNTDIFRKSLEYILIIIYINSLSVVPYSVLRKKREFCLISVIEVIATIFSCVGVFVAIRFNLGIYILFIQTLLRSIIVFLLSLNQSKIMQKRETPIKFEFLKKIYKYSIFEFFNNIFNYFIRTADNMLIAKYMDFSSLGFYDRAYRLILFPIKNIVLIITPLLHPILSKYKNEKNKMYEYFINFTKYITLISIPISIFIFFNSQQIIKIIYGEKWIYSAIYLKILSISLVPQMLNGIFQSFYLSTSNTKKMFSANIIVNILNISGILLGVGLKNLKLVVISITVVFYIKSIIDIYIINKIFKEKNVDFFKKMTSLYILTIISVISHAELIKKEEVSNIITMLYSIILLIAIFIVYLFITGEIKKIKGGYWKNVEIIDK